MLAPFGCAREPGDDPSEDDAGRVTGSEIRTPDAGPDGDAMADVAMVHDGGHDGDAGWPPTK